MNVNEALDEPVILVPPTNLAATASGSGTIQLTWNAANPASQRTSYRVRFRTSVSSGWTDATATQTTSFSHENTAPGVLYEYEVVTTDAVGNLSSAAKDYGLPLFHDDDPLTPQSTMIKGMHVARLRQAVDAWRQFAGLAVAFTYEAPTGAVQASHLTGMRDRLNDARALTGFFPFSYAGVSSPTPGALIDARHVDQLRAAMR